jgi:hypothetical protein
MSKPARFTQAELTRVLRAIELAGVKKKVRIDAAGDIWIEPADGKSTPLDHASAWVP